MGAPAPEPKAEAAAESVKAAAETVVNDAPPEPKVQVTPTPEPKAAAEPKKVEPKSMSEKIMEELEAVQKERERLSELTDRHLRRERLEYLRRIGAKPGVSDTDLLKLAPDADTTTPEGKAQIDAWRMQSPVFFNERSMQNAPDPAEISKGYKTSEFGTFNQGTALKILQKMTGSKS